MDREHDWHALATQGERHQACHRVMGMHDLHRFALLRSLLHQCRNRARKGGEARRVVDVRHAAFTVDGVAVEQARQIEQDQLCARSQLPVQHVHFTAIREREWRQPTCRE